MGWRRNELNLGQLVRERHPDQTFVLGQTTYRGSVLASDEWNGPGRIKTVNDALAGSLEARLHEVGRAAYWLDLRNPARVQRAWEVLRATGRGLADWQAETPPPLVAPEAAQRIVLQMDRDRLARRIARRFDAMLDAGALEEVRQALPLWQPGAQWTRAIGAAELKDHLEGRVTLAEARERAIIATRQYAKSQRIWLRNRMRGWPTLEV